MKDIFNSAIILLLIGLQSGCDYIDVDDFYQLTPDNLSHLYTDLDSLVLDGQSYTYQDTVAFLHNSNDTIFVLATTYIYSFAEPFNPNVYNFSATSTLYLNEQSDFRHAKVTVRKDGFADARMRIEMDMTNTESLQFNRPLDTAFIQGKTYNNVYKFDFTVNSTRDIKSLYFAKKFGFVKIERADGKIIERLDISKDEIRLLLTD